LRRDSGSSICPHLPVAPSAPRTWNEEVVRAPDGPVLYSLKAGCLLPA
jgi:hypothetical protein